MPRLRPHLRTPCPRSNPADQFVFDTAEDIEDLHHLILTFRDNTDPDLGRNTTGHADHAHPFAPALPHLAEE